MTDTFEVIVPTPTPREGQYTIDGRRYPRVSTILGVISKPGLESWRQRVGIEEAQRISQDAAGFGTAFHAAAALMDDTFPEWEESVADAELRPALRAYQVWAIENVSAIYAIEKTVHHARHLFAGTLDRVFRLRDGRLVIGDFKTGKSVDGTYRLQLTAYAEAWEEMGYEPVAGRLILHIPRERPGELRVIEYDDDQRDRLAWRACLRLWRWMGRHQHDYKQTRVSGSL